MIAISRDYPTGGYDLYNALEDGECHEVEFMGETYRMQFCGHRYGAENYLLVSKEDGTEKRWGWGWNQDVCFRCLADLEKGWGLKEHYEPYRVKVATDDK